MSQEEIDPERWPRQNLDEILTSQERFMRQAEVSLILAVGECNRNRSNDLKDSLTVFSQGSGPERRLVVGKYDRYALEKPSGTFLLSVYADSLGYHFEMNGPSGLSNWHEPLRGNPIELFNEKIKDKVIELLQPEAK